jgi:hypothetical protein
MEHGYPTQPAISWPRHRAQLDHGYTEGIDVPKKKTVRKDGRAVHQSKGDQRKAMKWAKTQQELLTRRRELQEQRESKP